MFSFFKKKPKQSFHDFGFLHTDMHSHLLPGIDDGAKDMEDALNLVKGLMDLGFRHLITTPHVYHDYYPNSTETIKEKGEALRRAVRMKGWEVKIDYAAEYFLDEHFEKRLAADDILLLPGKHLLFELPFFAPPPQLEEVIFQMTIKTYKPILAHPERYTFWFKKKEKYERLRDMGCLFQLNILSLAGHYGPEVRKNAEWLVEQQFIDLAGSDLHHEAHLQQLRQALDNNQLHQLDNITAKNHSLFTSSQVH